MIKKKVHTLYRSLIKEGSRREAHWLALLYLTANYDEEWRGHIDAISKDNPYPFSDWFPDGEDRVVIGFVRSEIDIPDEVIDIISAIGGSIESNEDYIQGYCKDKHGRRAKIGKVLNKELSMKNKYLKQHQAMPPEEQDADEMEVLKNTISAINDALNAFNTDPNRARSKENQYQIIISQNPHDVARSSYQRRWESCFDIGESPGSEDDRGSNAQTVFCEVRDGGMVAYLTHPDDNDIEDPYARILIRRFMGKDGRNIALAEKSVYGDDVPGFLEAVEDWLRERNVTVSPGVYKRLGGEYSDNYGEQEYVPPREEASMLKWMKSDFDIEKETVTWIVSDEDYDLLGENGWWRHHDPFSEKVEFMEQESDWYDEWYSESDGTKEFDSEIEARRFLESLKHYGDAEDYMKIKLRDEGYDDFDIEEMDVEVWEEKFDEYFEERFDMQPHTDDHTRQLQESVVKKLSEEKAEYSTELLTLAKDFIFEYYKRNANSMVTKFLETYPNILSGKEFANLSPNLASKVINSEHISDEKHEEFVESGSQMFDFYINFGEYLEDQKRRNSSILRDESMLWLRLHDAVNNGLSYIKEMSPEQKATFIKFADDMQNSEEIPEGVKNRIGKHMLHKMSIEGNPTPEEIYPLVKAVMDKYNMNVLTRGHEDDVGLNDVGYYIAKIAPNREYASELLPIFERQKANLDQIIDAIAESKFGILKRSLREEEVKELKVKSLQRLNYVIECLRTGQPRTQKYKWIF